MSLQKDRLSWALIGLFLLAVGTAAYVILLPQLQPHSTLRLGDGVFTARVVSAEEYAKQGGNSPAAQLGENRAVLYLHNSDGPWLVDMRERQELFDIVWLNSAKKVVHIVKNASADSASGAIFSSEKNARYVIELRGGTVDVKAIKINSTATFDENNIQGLKL
jgi:uncharacterized membrane protein (UPF0127 family)